MPSRSRLQHLSRAAKQRFSDWRVRRSRDFLRRAAERHARASRMPGHEFSDEGGRLNKLRFLRREHMLLDWSSWHSVVRDD